MMKQEAAVGDHEAVATKGLLHVWTIPPALITAFVHYCAWTVYPRRYEPRRRLRRHRDRCATAPVRGTCCA